MHYVPYVIGGLIGAALGEPVHHYLRRSLDNRKARKTIRLVVDPAFKFPSRR